MTMSQLSSADFRAITTSAATALHDEWRKNRHVKAALAFGDETEGVRSGAMDINGNSWQEITPAQARAWVPRPAEAYKYDTDRDIHLAHVGGFPLQDLPPCFSKDHKVNAASCLRLLVDNVADRPVDEKNIRRFYGPKVHELWLERQLVHGSSSVPDWVQDAGLDLHYDDLDEEEQGAYNMTVRICFQALENHGFGQESGLRGNIPEVGETVAGGRAFQIADDTKRLAEEDGASLRREHNGNTPKARFSPIKKPLLLANGFIAPSTLALSSEHEMAALPADTSLSSEAETKEEDEEKANDEETKLEVASAAAVRALKEAMVKSASARQALEAAVVLLEGSVETRIKRIALLVDGQEVESALAISPVEEGSGETAKHDDRYDGTVATAVTAVGMPSYRDVNNDAGRQSASRRQGGQRKEEEEDAIATAAAVAEVNDALAMAQQVAEQRAAAAIRAPGRHDESETEEALDRNEGVPSAPLSDSSSYHASSTSLESQHTDTAPPLPSSDMEIEEEVRLAEAEMALEEKAEAVARALNEKREAIAREQRKFAEAQAAAVAEAEIADAVAAVEAEAAMEAKAEAVAEVMVKTQLRGGEVGSVEDTLSETTPMTTNCSAGAITGAGKAQLRRTEACFGQKGQRAAPSSDLREVGSLEDNLVHERRDKAIEFCDETKVDPSLKQLPIESTGGSINNKGGIELEALSHPAGNSNVTGDDDERPQKNIKKKKKKKKGKGT